MGQRLTTRAKDLNELISTTQAAQRCAYGKDRAESQALRRRAMTGAITNVFPNMYADTAYWTALTPPERTLHIVRTLMIRHPDWVFGGITAAAIHGFEHQWKLDAHSVTIVDGTRGTTRKFQKVKRVHVPDAAMREKTHVQGIPVTTPARTLVDCSRTLAFRYALPIFDSALARGVSADDVIAACSGPITIAAATRLLHHADPRSENGGESFARGTMIEQCFCVPQIQMEFTDPRTGQSYRVDFAWTLPDGRIIVGEFDGLAKYEDPAMTRGKASMSVFQDERDREEALKRAGVWKVFRLTFRDVERVYPMVDRMVAAGVPQLL